MKNLLTILTFTLLIFGVHAQTVTTFAGSGVFANSNGTGTQATFGGVIGVAFDATGNLYVTDMFYREVRKITPAGVVSTLAASGKFSSGNGNGMGFTSLQGVVVDASGNLLVADAGNNLIHKITPSGVVTVFAGSGTMATTDGTGVNASFTSPTGITIDASGNVYVSEGSAVIRKITPQGVVTIFAGRKGQTGSTNGVGTVASFGSPAGLAVDSENNIYVADMGNGLIRKITPTGVVSTLAGSGQVGNTDGIGTVASFDFPSDVTVDSEGNVYVADKGNNLIRKVTSAGVVTTLAGSGAQGKTDDVGTAASFYIPAGVALDASGNVYVADYENHLIRKIIINNTTDISDQIVGDALVSVYPNPVSNTLNIKAGLQVSSYQITDLIGNVVLSGIPTSSDLDVSVLNNGLYFIQINTNKGLTTIKFSKN